MALIASTTTRSSLSLQPARGKLKALKAGSMLSLLVLNGRCCTCGRWDPNACAGMAVQTQALKPNVSMCTTCPSHAELDARSAKQLLQELHIRCSDITCIGCEHQMRELHARPFVVREYTPRRQQDKHRPEGLALPLGEILGGRPLSVQDGAAEARQVDARPLVCNVDGCLQALELVGSSLLAVAANHIPCTGCLLSQVKVSPYVKSSEHTFCILGTA